jgi:hypothetical protein
MSPVSRVRALQSSRPRILVGVALAAVMTATLTAPAVAAPTASTATAATAASAAAWGGGPDRDFDGDGFPDVLAVASNGDLRLYAGSETGPLTWGGRIGTGWAGFDHVFAAGDFSGDGLPDVMARDRNGNLFLYRGDGASGWLGGARIGTGWKGFTAILSPGDFNGDGTDDVIARDGSGRLFLYPGDGAGGWLRASQIGTGWGDFKFLVGAGDMDLSGSNDLTIITRGMKVWGEWMCAGGQDLYHYYGSGVGGFSGTPRFDGSSWCKFTAVIAGGNQTFVARDVYGDLWRYQRGQDKYGYPAWVGVLRVGTGWSGLRLVG